MTGYFPFELPPSFVGFCGCLAPHPSLTDFPPEVLLFRVIKRLPLIVSKASLSVGLDFLDSWVVSAFESMKVSEPMVVPGNHNPLISIKIASSIYCVVVCFGVYGAHYWRFICHDSGEACIGLGNISFRGLKNRLKICQGIVVLTLQKCVGACSPSKVECELQGTNKGSQASEVDCFDAPGRKQISEGRCTEYNNEEVENPRPSFVHSALGRMVQRISKCIEFKALGVVSQFQSPWMSSSSSLAGFGCAGPQLRFSVPSADVTFSKCVKARSLLSCWVRKGCSGPYVRGAARSQILNYNQELSTGNIPNSEHAPGIFHAEHHGTAEQQNCTDNRVRREWRDPSRTGKCSHRGVGRRQRRVLPSLPTIQGGYAYG
jgi:hypothetical protein